VSTRPDVIVCFSVRVAKTVKALIRDIPIVFIATSDPVAQGLVESYNHPGGNLTGFTLYEYSVTGKLVELVKEVAPGVTRVALLFNPENTSAIGYLQTLKRVTPRFQLALVELAVRDATTIENAVSQFAADPNGALLLPPDVTTRVYRDLIIGLAAKYKLPAVYTSRADAKAGGLMAYGPDLRGQFRGAAVYVDRILKGEMAANLPIQAPTDYALIVNMMTARNLGVSIPESVLFRATEVIE
jgi:putative ABC transport system substrate-binding protein